MIVALALTLGPMTVALPRSAVVVGVSGPVLLVEAPLDTEIAGRSFACLLPGSEAPAAGTVVGVGTVGGQVCAVYDLGEEAS